MDTTTNLKLKKPGYDDGVDIMDINHNMDKIDTEIGIMKSLVTTSGAVNAYTATIPGLASLGTLTRLSLKFHVTSTGASTLNINGLGAKGITKPGGGNPNIKIGGVYTLVYDGTNFQLQGEGGDYGTATSDDVRQGKTIGTENGIVNGTAVDHGPVSATITDISAESGTYIIPKGFHSGLMTIRAKITGLVASVIKAGATVGGILGTFTSDATATAKDMLIGKSAYVNGNKVEGTIPSRGASTITPGPSDQTMLPGQYLSGVQTISGVVVPPSKVLNDTTIAGTKGTMLNYSGTTSGNLTTGNLTSVFDFATDGGGAYGRAKLKSPFIGYVDNTTEIVQNIYGLNPSVIKKGNTIGSSGIGAPVGAFTGVGTAGQSHVLSGYTFSNDTLMGASGSMVNRGAVSSTLATQGGVYTIPAGYHNGAGKITSSFLNLIAGNIRKGINIGGVVGNYEASLASGGKVYQIYFNITYSGTTTHTIPANAKAVLIGDYMEYFANLANRFSMLPFSGKSIPIGRDNSYPRDSDVVVTAMSQSGTTITISLSSPSGNSNKTRYVSCIFYY